MAKSRKQLCYNEYYKGVVRLSECVVSRSLTVIRRLAAPLGRICPLWKISVHAHALGILG